MSGINDWIRDRFAPTIHAKTLAEGKLSNTNREKAYHLGYKIANNRVVIRIRKALDTFVRKVRSQRLYVRRVTKFDTEVLKLVHNGKPINIEALKRLDLDKTEKLAAAYEKGIETVKSNLDTVRTATAEERARLTSLRETREAQHRVKITGINQLTLTYDANFATSNRKMVRDYAMHLMLYEGVKNNEGHTCTLAGRFKEARKSREHDTDVKRSELSVARSQRRLALEQEKKVVETDSQIQELDRQIAALRVDDVAVLKSAMLAFHKDVMEYTGRYKDQIKSRRQAGREGTHVLNPKPLINWRAASGQDLMNMLTHYTKPENVGELYAFRESHESALNLPSSRYGLSSQSPSEEIMKHIIAMERSAEVEAANVPFTEEKELAKRDVVPLEDQPLDDSTSDETSKSLIPPPPGPFSSETLNSDELLDPPPVPLSPEASNSEEPMEPKLGSLGGIDFDAGGAWDQRANSHQERKDDS